MTELLERKIRRYGWKPSLPGLRPQLANTTGLKVLPEVDPRAEMPPVYDQGELGSCTANASCGAFEYDRNLDHVYYVPLSRLWVYWQERRLEGTLTQGDCGAMGSDAFKAAETVGVPPESLWPYDIENFNPKAPPAQASKFALSTYHLTKPVHSVLQNETSIKQVLSNNQTVAFGFTVYESFEEPSYWTQGKMPIPRKGEQILGGHEVLLCGYLKAYPNHALVRNSWGAAWELGGYFLFPWTVLLNKNVCSDFRTIVRAA